MSKACSAREVQHRLSVCRGKEPGLVRKGNDLCTWTVTQSYRTTCPFQHWNPSLLFSNDLSPRRTKVGGEPNASAKFAKPIYILACALATVLCLQGGFLYEIGAGDKTSKAGLPRSCAAEIEGDPALSHLDLINHSSALKLKHDVREVAEYLWKAGADETRA